MRSVLFLGINDSKINKNIELGESGKYFACNNCKRKQFETEFGECATCGYEELYVISEDEFNNFLPNTSGRPNSKNNIRI